MTRSPVSIVPPGVTRRLMREIRVSLECGRVDGFPPAGGDPDRPVDGFDRERVQLPSGDRHAERLTRFEIDDRALATDGVGERGRLWGWRSRTVAMYPTAWSA